MPHYEIVIQGKGTGEPVVSPTTYATLEEAEAALEPLLEMLKSGGFVRLSWFGGEAANINRVFVDEADQRRPPDPRSLTDLVEGMEREIGDEDEPTGRSDP